MGQICLWHVSGRSGKAQPCNNDDQGGISLHSVRSVCQAVPHRGNHHGRVPPGGKTVTEGIVKFPPRLPLPKGGDISRASRKEKKCLPPFCKGGRGGISREPGVYVQL